jgi:hypothetical protein
MADIPERDWTVFRMIRERALQRLAERALAEIHAASSPAAASPIDTFRAVYRIVNERSADIAFTFDDVRRSRAHFHLARMVTLGIVTQAELAQLSEATRDAVTTLASVK